MDFDLLPQMIIVLSIAGILFIVGKNFSKVKEAAQEEVFLEEGEKEKKEREKFMYLYERARRRLNIESYHKIIASFWLWFEKFLRKTRLIVVKLDGKMFAQLEKVRQKNVKTVEEWKKMAEMAEKNIQQQGFFAAKGAFRKRRKLEGKIDVAEDISEMPQETIGTPIEEPEKLAEQAKEGPVIGMADEAPGEIFSLEAGAIVYEDGARKEEYAGASEAGIAESQESVEPVQTNWEKMPYEESEAEIERKKKVASVIEKLEEVAEELEGAELYENTRTSEVGQETWPNEETAPEQEAEMEIEAPESGEEEPEAASEEENIRTKKEQECIEVLMQNPADIKAYWKLGIIYSKRRNYEDALACFRQIVKIDPTYTKAKQKVIEVMEKMKKRGK